MSHCAEGGTEEDDDDKEEEALSCWRSIQSKMIHNSVPVTLVLSLENEARVERRGKE